jgi:hypothetical protein
MSSSIICDGKEKISMITKEHEEKAWEKLKKLFPDSYITLNAEYKQYDNGEEHKKYQAYVSLAKPYISYEFDAPMEAVDNLIEKINKKRRKK